MLPLSPNAKSALLVVDMQEFFFTKPDRCKYLDHVVVKINSLIQAFDEVHCPVFHVISAYQSDGSDWDLKMQAAGSPELIINSPEAAILPRIMVKPNHYHLRKTRYSAFFKTNLAEQLQQLKIQRVFVVGAYTHYCVNATVFDAYAHDFVPGLLTDAVISHLEDEAALMIERMVRNGYHVMSTTDCLASLLSTA